MQSANNISWAPSTARLRRKQHTCLSLPVESITSTAFIPWKQQAAPTWPAMKFAVDSSGGNLVHSLGSTVMVDSCVHVCTRFTHGHCGMKCRQQKQTTENSLEAAAATAATPLPAGISSAKHHKSGTPCTTSPQHETLYRLRMCLLISQQQLKPNPAPLFVARPLHSTRQVLVYESQSV